MFTDMIKNAKEEDRIERFPDGSVWLARAQPPVWPAEQFLSHDSGP